MHSYRRTDRKKRPRDLPQQKLRLHRTREAQYRTQAILEAIAEYQATHQRRV